MPEQIRVGIRCVSNVFGGKFYCHFMVTQTRQVTLFKYRPVLKLAAVTVTSCATV